jgi:putative nucleotidyltransferase-like protein
MLGLLPLLQALVAQRTDADCRYLSLSELELAVRDGLGPILAHVSGGASAVAPSMADQIRAADLTARILTGEKVDLLVDVLDAAAAVGCRPVLLKGISAAFRYYREPHLRTMGDIDLFVRTDQQTTLERELRALGFRQASHEPAAAFVDRHHSMPFWHRQRPVCIEVHTRLHPRQHALACDRTYSYESVTALLSSVNVEGRSAATMNDELHLVYTSARWAERFDHHRGIFAILDVAQLLAGRGRDLNWDHVYRLAAGSWSGTALNLMLSFLHKYALVRLPSEVLSRVSRHDRHTNAATLGALHALAARYLIQRKPFGRVLNTQRNVETIWSVLIRPSTPASNMLRIPYSLVGAAYRTQNALTGRVWRRA